MDIYVNYLEFLDDLMKWGDDSRTRQPGISLGKSKGPASEIFQKR